MPAVVKKYPLYVSDEPITYRSFTGGINSDPSNEHLLPNELRDALNVHYQSGGIVKRKGAKVLSTIVSNEDIINVQGVSLFTNKITYIIVAADGKLYYGIYTPNAEINITRLPISFRPTNQALVHNPLDLTVGLSKYFPSTIPVVLNHDGYVIENNTLINNRFIGNYYTLSEGTVIVNNDYFIKDNLYYRFVTSEQNPTFTVTFIKPPTGSATSNTYWQQLSEEEVYDVVGGNNVLKNFLNGASEWTSQTTKYYKDQVVKVTVNSVSNYFKCLVDHLVRNDLEVSTSTLFTFYTSVEENLVFQNFKNIEGGTFNNVLYLATGTRIVEVFPDSNGKLLAFVLIPKTLNGVSYSTIGENYLSPYPELCLETEKDQAITSIGALIPLYYLNNGHEKQFILKPIMTLAANEEINEYKFRWEKFIDNQWVVVKSFLNNTFATTNLTGQASEIIIDYSYLVVDDADKYKYRVTFAKSFEINITPTATISTEYVLETLIGPNGSKINDLKINKIDGSFFGQAATVLYDVNLKPNQLFKTIQSCSRIHVDGNKFLYYDDAFNSGEWFKTVIENPNFITLRGGLSFKTNKNESLIKVTAFAGYIIAFANSSNIGGSIHLVQGNGDDVESDRFYSPYRRKTISPNVSCDNPNTVQVAENLLFFKHFDTVYYFQAGDLDAGEVNLNSANDKIRVDNKNFVIPWNDNNCLSEVTEDYYALFWPEKNIVEDGQVIQVYPATRIKLYYKYYQNVQGKIYFAWLRDESVLFNSRHFFYVNSKPIYLYNNTLVSLNENYYKDFDDVYTCYVKLKAYDLEKPKMYKLLDNVTLFYNRNQYTEIDVEVEGVNEAGHKIIEWKNKPLTQNKKTLRVGDTFNKEVLKLDSTLIDSKVINSVYKFPFLLVEIVVKSRSEKDFSFSSITFNYSTVDIPDQNPYGLYKNIVRKGEDYRVLTSDSTLLESVKKHKQGLKNDGVRVFVSEDKPLVILNTGDLWYDIE
jgi:hypothetical protein